MRASGSSRAPSGTFASLGVWSPDGASIAEVGSGGSIDLVAPDGTGTRVLLAGSGNDQATAVAWSHDSKLVAYSAPDGVHVVPADGSAPPRLDRRRQLRRRPELLT